MICKQSLVVDSMANRFNFISQALLHFELDVQGVRSVIRTEVSVLDGSWVAVVVHESPFSLMGLKFLVRGIVKLHLLGWHDELVSLVTGFGLGSQQGQDGDTAASPLRNRLGKVFDGDC